MYNLYKVQILPGVAYEVVCDADLKVALGNSVVVRCERHEELGRVVEILCNEPLDAEAFGELERRRQAKQMRRLEGERYPQVERLATHEDLLTLRENEASLSHGTLAVRERIEAYHLPMRLVKLQYSFDRKLLFCVFTADGRVDFRELIRDLSALYHCRIEMRQIGPRDEAAIIGGIGICGRPFCCRAMLNLTSAQNMQAGICKGQPMNPMNALGTCGKSKCCLQFED